MGDLSVIAVTLVKQVFSYLIPIVSGSRPHEDHRGTMIMWSRMNTGDSSLFLRERCQCPEIVWMAQLYFHGRGTDTEWTHNGRIDG